MTVYINDFGVATTKLGFVYMEPSININVQTGKRVPSISLFADKQLRIKSYTSEDERNNALAEIEAALDKAYVPCELVPNTAVWVNGFNILSVTKKTELNKTFSITIEFTQDIEKVLYFPTEQERENAYEAILRIAESAGEAGDYNSLDNLPSLNGTKLQGNLTNEDAGIPTKTSQLENDANFVPYQVQDETGRKFIVLMNHDGLQGEMTDGTQVNLATVSKEDIADFGATGLHANLNTKDVVTINDKDVVATDKDLALKADKAKLEQTVTDIDNKLGLKADKATTYTKTEVDSIIAKIDQFKVKVVDVLPETGEELTVYLVPKDSSLQENDNVYDEYIWTDGKWEHIGDTKIDLSDYITNAQLAEELDKKENKAIYIQIPLRSLKDEIYSQETILGWFGVESTTELKEKIAGNTIAFVKWGITLSTNPHFYRFVPEYFAFESDNQIKLVFNGLDSSNNESCKYEILINLDGTIIEGNSNVSLKILSVDTDDVTADQVEYINGDIKTVKEALDQLLYISPDITSFTGGGTYEKGSVINNVNLSWTLNKGITSQSINQGIGDLDISLRKYDISEANLTEDTTYTLTVSDGKNSDSASTSVLFRQKGYWGVSTETSLTNEQILALSQEFSTGRNQNRTFDCSGGKYFYFVIPTQYCNGIQFKVGGLSFTGMEETTIQLTNASGYEASYNVYRCSNIQTGSAINVEVF